MKKIFTSIVGLFFIANIFSQTTFTNSGSITVGPAIGNATPYPSNITVSGMPTSITSVTITLNNISHTFPDDIDVMLVAPNGDRFVLMSDAGGNPDWTGVTITLSDAGAALMADNALNPTGTYRPTNYVGADGWGALPNDVAAERAAPIGAATFASRFNGDNPNGTWSLYVRDDAAGDGGAIAGGWSITINACNPTAPTAVAATPATIPCGGSSNLNATSAMGTIRWYTVSTGGTSIGSSASGVDFAVSPSGTTTFYAEGFDGTYTTCSRTPVTVTVTGTQPSDPTGASATPNPVCPGSNSSLTATSAGNTIRWFTAPVAGTLVGTSASGGTVVVAPLSTTTYYAESFNGVCASANRVPVTITTISPPSFTTSASPSSICAPGSSTLMATSNTALTYCTPPYANGTGFGDYVGIVQLNTLNNSTTGAASPYYTLFPSSGSTTTTLVAGSTYTITLGAGTYTQNDLAAWIDFNQSGVLNDAGEKLGETDNLGASPATTSFTFTVPAGAINGTTRLRIRDVDHPTTNDMDPCALHGDGFGGSYGETEDYIITITGGFSPINYVWNPGVLSGASVSVSPALTTTYTVTGTDVGTGCTNTATTVVTVLGTTPVVTCPANQTASANASCQAVVTYTPTTSAGTFSYVFSGATTGSGSGTGSGSTFNSGVTTVTLTATDVSCTSTCSFTITVNDNTVPVLTLPSNITVSNTPGSCAANVTYTAPTATDNCLPNTVGFSYPGPDVPLPDLATTTSTINTSGLMTSLGTTVTLNSVCINLNHTWDSDLSINLISPLGTIYNLSDFEGGSGDNYTNTCFNMSAGTSIVGQSAPFTGTFIPEGGGGFASYDGQNPNGTWTLSITDAATGDLGTLFNWSLNFTNSSPTITQTAGLASGATYPVGTTTNTFMATDLNGNTTTNSFTVTVNDTELPTISCPANISVNNTPGLCSATVTYTAPIGTDNCPGATTTQTAGLASGASFPVGTTTNTFRVTDATGNTSTCSFTVTVVDNELPSISCPSNIAVNNTPGFCSAVVTYTAPTGTDNCSSSTTQIAGLASGATFPLGTTTNTFRVTDASGNTATCSFTVTVTDNQPPTVSAPTTVDLECASDLPAAQTTIAGFLGLAGASATDNCTASGSLTISSTTGPLVGTSCNGTITRTYTITDAASNSINVNHVYTVTDNTAPTLTGAPFAGTTGTDACMSNATVAAPFSAASAVTGYSDNCNTVSATLTGTSVTGTDCGWTVTYTFSVIDACGNTLPGQSYSNTGSDQTDPVISCPANITQNAIPLNCGRVITYSTPTATDNCTGAVVTQTDGTGYTSGQLFPVGITTLIYTATDVCGNTSTCSFTVTIVDDQDPIITSCPSNISQNNAVGQCNQVVSWVAPTASDNCPGVVMTSNFTPGSTFPVGVSTVVYTATDASLNTATCSFTVTVVDAEDPLITCPADITVGNDVGSCGALVTFAATSTDNCSSVITYSQNPGTSFPVGTTTVTATATDPAGHTDVCTFTITVNDTEAPGIICNAPITVSNAPGTCGATVTYSVTSSDNCVGQTVTQTAGLPSGSNFPAGVTTNTFVVTDAAGNTNSCSFTVTVNDTEMPTITCPGNSTVSNDLGVCGATVNYTVTSSDNCAATVTQMAGLPSGSVFPVGLTTNTFVVTDPSGNTASCSFTITVTDDEDPVIVCPSNISTTNDAGDCGAVVTYTLPACSSPSVVLFSQMVDDGPFDSGYWNDYLTPQVLADDFFVPPGNTFNIDQILAQLWEAPLGIMTSVNLDFYADGGGTPGALITSVNVTPADWTSTYLTSNFGYDMSNFNISLPSTVSLPGGPTGATYWIAINSTNTVGQTVWSTTNIYSGNSSAYNLGGPWFNTGLGHLFELSSGSGGSGGLSDNCGCPTLTQTAGLPSGSQFPVGTTTNIFTATDAAGNTSTCSFTVTVADTESPVITCPGNISVNNDAGVCGASVVYSVTSSDNCAHTVTQMTGQASGTVFPIGTTTNSFIVTDASGNTSTCSFTVTVTDSELPTIICNAPIIVNNDAGLCGASVTYSVTSSDNCSGQTVTQTGGLASGTIFPVGTTTNSFIVTDASGNTATCSFTVTVTDNELPTISCNAPITTTNDPGVCSAMVTYTVSSSDNCASTLTQTAGLPSGSNFPVGTTTNSFIVTDASGNTATCSFTVTVTDNESPVPNVGSLPNATGVCSVTVLAPQATDNCSGTLTASPASVTFSSGGTFTQVWTYTDGAGNTSTQTQTVIVSSPEADITGNGNPINHTSSAYSLTNHTDFGSVPECSGTMSRTYTITNNGIGTLNLTGSPLVKVTGLNPGDFTVTSMPANSIPQGGSTTFTVVFNPSAPGNRYARFTIANDDCNESGYYFQVRGVGSGSDVTAPVPTIASLPIVSGSCNATVSTTPTANDACAGLIIGTTTSSLSYTSQGTYTIVWSYNDGNGNISTQTQTVLVQDLTAPTAMCQSTSLQLDPTGSVTLTASMIDNGSFDNCGTLSYIGIYGAVKLINGTFNTNLTGWSVANGTVYQGSGGNPGGFAWLNGTGAAGTDPSMQQMFSDLIPGETYVIRGQFRSVTGTGSTPGQVAFGIDLDGTQIATKGLPNPITTWTPFSVQFTATSTMHTVRFRGEINGTDGDIGIDNVRIDGTAKKYNCFTRGTNNVTLVVSDVYGNTATCNTTVDILATINPCPNTLEITDQVNESGEENTNNEENSTSIEDATSFNGKLYPNPSNGVFNLELNSLPRGNVNIKLVDALGQVLYTNNITAQNTYFDFSYLRAATYYIQVTTDEGSFTKQIIITHGY